jgi:membrane-bound inhibitor of C-type lysozyme
MEMKSRQLLAIVVLLISLVASVTFAAPAAVLAQENPPGQAEPDPAQAADEGEVSLYDQLQSDAQRQDGVLTIYEMDGSWYWELPADLLGQDLFWYAELSRTPADYVPQLANTTLGARMVRFERRGDVVDVVDLTDPLGKREGLSGEVQEQPTSDEKVSPVRIALEESASPATILTLPIVDEGPEGSLVVDVSSIFADEVAEFSASSNLGLAGVQVVGTAPDRSYVVGMKAFPENVDVTSFLTLLRAPNPLASLGEGGPPSTASVEVRHSITQLPEEPMMPRLFDPRVGYFDVGFVDYSGEEANRPIDRSFITRYRLEKQDPDAEISDPVEPIVYYISPEVPEKWRPYFKQAVEDWQVAFEEAGFSDAIIARDAPTPEEDPDWSPFDTRYSVIRWLAQPIANAQGPNIHDPRTGEILAAHVLIWADVVDLAQQWYFLQASANDEGARELPLDDELMGRIMRYVVSHEIGHTLGLRHNHRASQIYTIDQLRDPDFTAENGTSPSIMSYGRFNYIAQPEDGVTNVVPQIGPYDRFAIQWGYAPIPEVESSADEWAVLDELAARQVDNPELAFHEDFLGSVDPTVLTENLGDDRIEATRLGIQNLERVMAYLVDATTETGSDFSELERMYNALIDQRATWLKSVAVMVGGVEETRTLAGRGDAQFQRVPADEQRAAVAFLMENLVTPQAFLDADALNLFAQSNAIETLQNSQVAVLDGLLTTSKYALLADGEALDPANAYTVAELLADVQAGLFAEYDGDEIVVDPIRRELQRHYLETLQNQISPADSSGGLDADNPLAALFSALIPSGGNDLRGAARYNLGRLRTQLADALPTIIHVTTAIHVQDLLAEIDAVLGGASTGMDVIGTSPEPSEDTGAAADSDVIEATFACPDGTTMDTVFDNAADTVTVTLPDGTVTLPRAVSASGARYSDGTTTFWNKGDEALVEVNGEIVYQNCVEQR